MDESRRTLGVISRVLRILHHRARVLLWGDIETIVVDRMFHNVGRPLHDISYRVCTDITVWYVRGEARASVRRGKDQAMMGVRVECVLSVRMRAPVLDMPPSSPSPMSVWNSHATLS